jgi:hypothetical protein
MAHADHLEAGPDFDWNPTGEDAEHIVVPDQASIAVYRNARNEIVILQDGHLFQGEDQTVIVRGGHVAALAFALLREAGLSSRKPLAPQIAELMAAPAPFDMKEAGRLFAALENELADSEGEPQPGPIRKDVARMMAERPDIAWPRVFEHMADLFTEDGELRPLEDEAAESEQMQMPIGGAMATA